MEKPEGNRENWATLLWGYVDGRSQQEPQLAIGSISPDFAGKSNEVANGINVGQGRAGQALE